MCNKTTVLFSQKSGFLASVPGFVVGSHPAYWKLGWVGFWVWLKLATDHTPSTRGGSKWAPYTKYSPIVVTIALADVTNPPPILDFALD
jgi:hypothetical protein